MISLKDKRGFIDPEVFATPAFLILVVLAISATVLGYIASKKMDMIPMPVWQLLVIIAVEIVASYFFAARE